MKCATCVYFEPDQKKFGWCHRFPPQVIGTDLDTTIEFPYLSKDEFCGEYAVPEPDEDAIPEGKKN